MVFIPRSTKSSPGGEVRFSPIKWSAGLGVNTQRLFHYFRYRVPADAALLTVTGLNPLRKFLGAFA